MAANIVVTPKDVTEIRRQKKCNDVLKNVVLGEIHKVSASFFLDRSTCVWDQS